MKFEWDEKKNRINRQKHSISFETAMLVFNDDNRIEIYDFEHSGDENRYKTIGCVNDILFVVYTERKENIRLISARLATKRGVFTMIKTATWDKDQKPTDEMLREIREAAKKEIVFDEDSPEMTPAMEKAFRLVAKNRNTQKKMTVS